MKLYIKIKKKTQEGLISNRKKPHAHIEEERKGVKVRVIFWRKGGRNLRMFVLGISPFFFQLTTKEVKEL